AKCRGSWAGALKQLLPFVREGSGWFFYWRGLGGSCSGTRTDAGLLATCRGLLSVAMGCVSIRRGQLAEIVGWIVRRHGRFK
ncbi:MAG TPA: hypothetical protein DCP71_04670, partial [Verrucomicrobiales bacterium]|nr:hypothetical protein [Verrucomicrobiales bacterium]